MFKKRNIFTLFIAIAMVFSFNNVNAASTAVIVTKSDINVQLDNLESLYNRIKEPRNYDESIHLCNQIDEVLKETLEDAQNYKCEKEYKLLQDTINEWKVYIKFQHEIEVTLQQFYNTGFESDEQVSVGRETSGDQTLRDFYYQLQNDYNSDKLIDILNSLEEFTGDDNIDNLICEFSDDLDQWDNATYEALKGYILAMRENMNKYNQSTTPTKITNASVKLSTKTYTGKNITQVPTVKIGSTTLKANTDFTYKMSNNKNVGKAKVIITGKGNYTGSKTVYFNIIPKGTSLSSVKAAKKGFTAKWKKQATQTTGYQLQYSLKSNFTSATTVTISKNSTVSKKVTKLKAKKKYYVHIRTYKTVSGTKYYSSWSGHKTVTTKK